MPQPLDQVIVCSFKVGYRKLLLMHVRSQISSCKSSEELAKSVSVLDAISWTTRALKKVEPGCVLKCFKKEGFLSTSEVATGSTTEESEKELVDLVANLDSNVSVEEYVKIDDNLSIEEENLHVSNFIHRDTTEALALPEDDDEESPMEDCKIKHYSEALKYSEQLKQFFLNNEDSEGLTKLNPMKIHLDKQNGKNRFGRVSASVFSCVVAVNSLHIKGPDGTIASIHSSAAEIFAKPSGVFVPKSWPKVQSLKCAQQL
ncbi:hypothetical protein AVEN_41928-1 [Araneus ventricosus]|uniref:DDE-1 domain-containing protein n=1 Tax=Araneus ventricosus TaxID=182803 RepID=A0A4Y2AF46_ARAVE|nr:hypothetical protein AVEN_41928-1 [Araneus ventricosus]